LAKESNWSNTVYQEGLLGMGFAIAARLLADPTWIIPNLPPVGGASHRAYLTYSGIGTLFGGTIAVPDPTGPFPWGLAVEPP